MWNRNLGSLLIILGKPSWPWVGSHCPSSLPPRSHVSNTRATGVTLRVLSSYGWNLPSETVASWKGIKWRCLLQPEMACSNLFSPVQNRGQKTVLSEWKAICLMLFFEAWDRFHLKEFYFKPSYEWIRNVLTHLVEFFFSFFFFCQMFVLGRNQKHCLDL